MILMNYRNLHVFLTLLVSLQAQASSLQEQWQRLYQQSWDSSALTIAQTQLSQYPQQLLLSTSDFADLTHYSWQEIVSLYQVTQDCMAPSPIPVHLAKAIEFELALCRQQPLKPIWFNNPPLLHPAGGSFADRYLDSFSSQSQLQTVAAQLSSTLSANHPQHPLYAVFKPLSLTGRDALIGGYRAWFENGLLWLNGEQGWKRVPRSTWQPIAEALGITLDARQCSYRYSNVCVSFKETFADLSTLVLTAFSLLLLFMLLRVGYLKRQQNKSRRFILQLLTHELRTPIASLGLTTEIFRDQFDQFDDLTQRAFWRLTEDYQRLSQLTENSKAYLCDNSQTFTQCAWLSEWLEQVSAQHGISYQLEQDKSLDLPYYWLGVCLNNLILNAIHHGARPILIDVISTDSLRITVSDQGQFPSRYQRCFHRKSTNNNMGIGLQIVKHLMQKMGGRLIIATHPTRITLELPL